MIFYSQYHEFLENVCSQKGVLFLGVTSLGEEPDFQKYLQWISEKKHASMKYMEQNLHCRKDPRHLLEGANAVALFAMPYGQIRHEKKYNFEIAQYAKLKDYHKTLKRIGSEIYTLLKDEYKQIQEGRVVVDSAPILERSLAGRSGKGFIGKNTLFIMPKFGSYYLLFEILLKAELEIKNFDQTDPNTRGELGGCGTCKRCQTFCPTGALDQEYRLDANRCLSYLTIEHRDEVPIEFWIHFKKTIFGCDICQNVCPYNRNKEKISNSLLVISETPPLEEIALMDQQYYESTFGGTPTTRTKKNGLQRNALIAMVVSGHPQLQYVINCLTKSEDPLIQKTLKQIPNWEAYMNRLHV